MTLTGIGRYTAIALLNEGWNVVVTARRLEALQETQEMSSNAESCLCVAGDITDETFAINLFEQAIAKFGECSYISYSSAHNVNNAGRLDLLFNV